MKTRLALIATLLLTTALLAFAGTANAHHDDADCQRIDGGMDYGTYLCTDTKDPLCPVYTVTYTDWGAQKRCFGVLPA
jgi:hypothetical protein